MYDGDIPNKHIERGEKFLIKLALRNAVQVPSNTVTVDAISLLIGKKIVRLVFADDSQQIEISGKQISDDTVNVRTGWNLIGTVSNPVAVGSSQVIPSSLSVSEFYGYNLAYQIIDILQPGYGYWVKVNQNGRLILRTSVNR